jgi:hypothetical protein
MSLVERVRHVIVPPPPRPPVWRRLAAAVAAAVLVAAGIWVTGAVLSDDATVAMLLTGGWLVLAGIAAVAVGWRWRGFALPVVAAYAVTAGVLGGYLFLASTVDTRVDEQVVVAQRATAATATGTPGGGSSAAPRPARSPAAPVLVADGTFRSAAHETSGRAGLVDLPAGGRVLTLTDLATDPGPDLRVYLVPGDGSNVRGAADLGALKGNKGTQQYAVPAGAPSGAVVIWCRAFSVSFGVATLR